MNATREEILWKSTATGAAVLAAVLTRSAIKKGWRVARKTDPPVNPSSRHVSWGDALLFTALTGSLVGMARLAATRGAARGWKKMTGSEAPED